MKFLPLIIKNVLRNRRRTILMSAGIAVAVFVISALLAVESGFGQLIGSAEDTLLNVRERGIACPVTSRVFDTYLTSIKQNPLVRSATGVLRGLYSYQKRENMVALSGVDYEAFRALKSIQIVKGSEQAFQARPDAALVGQPLAILHGWREGQTVSMEQSGVKFTVAGVFVSPDRAYEAGVLLHKDYLAKLQRDEGKSTYLVVALKDPSATSAVSMAIDSEFRNYPKPTKTQSERASREREVQDFLEIRRMLSLIVLAAIVVSMLGAANSVSMSVRERTREVGILRSLGLQKPHILGIIVGESIAVALAGGAVGIGLVALLMGTEQVFGGLIVLSLHSATLVIAISVSLAIGLIGAVFPAIRAVRLPIVDALRPVD